MDDTSGFAERADWRFSEYRGSEEPSGTKTPTTRGDFAPELRDLAALDRISKLRDRLGELSVQKKIESHIFSNGLHELRTPLVSVRGYARMILEGHAGAITPQQREFLEIVLNNTNRLVDHLNSLTRVASGQQLRIQSFDIRTLCEESLELLRLQREKKSVEVIRHNLPGTFIVRGDREKLLLVIYKLLFNAIEIAIHGARIHLEFSQDQDQELIKIRISDPSAGNSSGIVKDQLDREGGQPVPDHLSQETGFSMVQDIVWQHGGRMSATSSPGHGYTFTVAFPVIQPDDFCNNEKEDYG